MFSNKTPFLFPHQCVSYLREMRDESQWSALVDRVAVLPETGSDSLAFQLMMIRICGCMRCTTYKANLGCSTCSQRAVRNSKSATATLLHWFAKAQDEVRVFLNEHPIEASNPEVSIAA
jgi:hypothetical protein